MGFSIGSVVNSVANISSRKSDEGKKGESSLYEFYTSISNTGVQIKSNFEVEFLQIAGFQFYCQSVNIPGIKSQRGELFYKGRSIQVPIIAEQDHEFQWTVLNDASGIVYTTIRRLMIYDYDPGRRMLDNGYNVMVKSRGDQTNNAGMNIVMQGVRINNVSGLDYSHTDSSIQTFTVDGYVNFTDFQIGQVQKKDGLLGKVDKISGKISSVLGK